ncbi:MAG: hypothetical protein V1767_08825 [Chloroflexota bacterium]
MQNKNAIALFITLTIALAIAWFIWRDASKHIWTAWLFGILFLIFLVMHALFLFGKLNSDEFDGWLLLNVIVISFFTLFLNTQTEMLAQPIKIFGYFVAGISVLILIFTGVRFLQHQSS